MAQGKSTFEIDFVVKIKNLDKNLAKVDARFDNVEQKVKKTTKSTGFFSRSVGELSNKMKILSTVGLIGIITGLINAGKALFGFSKQLEKTTKQVADLTGKSGEDLKKFTAQIQSTADVFEQDFNEVLITANTVAKEFGITQEEALERINKGFVDGSNASNQFLDILKEYPTQLKAVGLNAEQTFAIINQQVEEGIYADKGVDAIKEAGLRLREMPDATKKALDAIGLSSSEITKSLEEGSKSVFDVIQDVSTQMSKLPPQSAMVGTAIADIFGGPGEDAGLRYLTTLKDINLEQSKQNVELTDAQKLQQQQLENQTKINELMASFFGENSTGFSQMIADLTTIGIDLIVGMIDNIKKLITWFEDLADSSKGFRNAITLSVEAVKLLFTFTSNSIKAIIPAFKGLGTIIEGLFTLSPEKVKEGFTKAFEAGKAVFESNLKAFNETQAVVEQEFEETNEQAKKDRRAERFEERKEEVTEQTNAINEIVVAGLQQANARILKEEQALNKARLGTKIKTVKTVVDVEEKGGEKLRGIDTANALANIDLTKNVGKQTLGVFKGEAIGALVKSILSNIPFPFNVVLAGLAGATVNALFNKIPAFQEGVEEGLVGGNSPSGDRLLARVNTGEAILNPSQQKEFINLARGNGSSNDSGVQELALQVGELATELAFRETNTTVETKIDVTNIGLLEVTEQGEIDRTRLVTGV